MIPNDLKPLTALRFFAAFWVVLFAWWGVAFEHTPGFIAKGYLGVDLFFVLSGFILCHVYLQPAGEGRFRYGGFLWNRLARVYPLHLFTLLGVGLMAGAAAVADMNVDGNVLSWETLPANILMLHAWGVTGEAGWNHPSWSISAEWFAYLSFPIFAAAAFALRSRPVLATALAVFVLFAGYAGYEALSGGALTQATFMGGAVRIVPPFAFGCAIFLLWRSGVLGKTRFTGTQVALAALAVSLLGIGLSAGLGGPDALTVSFFGVQILALAGLAEHESPFTSAPLVFLGEASYSLYMICIPFKLVAVNAAQKVLGVEGLPAWAWIPLVALLPLLSGVSYLAIEKPARAWMKGVAERGKKPQAAVQAA